MSDDAREEPEDSRPHGWQKLRGKFSRRDGPLASLAFRKQLSSPDNEVEEFLRPSSASPTEGLPVLAPIDTASSKPFWATRPEDLREAKWRPTKPPRRRGLKVGFVGSEAEIIGIGGDGAVETTLSISDRRKQQPAISSRSRASSTSAYPHNRIPRRPVSHDGPENVSPRRRAVTRASYDQSASIATLPTYVEDSRHALPNESEALAPSFKVDQPLEGATPYHQQRQDEPRQGRSYAISDRDARGRATSHPSSPRGTPRMPATQIPVSSGDRAPEKDTESVANGQSKSHTSPEASGMLYPSARSPHPPTHSIFEQRSPEASPSRGLRRMRAEEGLAHRNSMTGAAGTPRSSNTAAYILDDPHLSAEAPPPYTGPERRPGAHSRTPSQQSRYSPSPEPITRPQVVKQAPSGTTHASPPGSSHGTAQNPYDPVHPAPAYEQGLPRLHSDTKPARSQDSTSFQTDRQPTLPSLAQREAEGGDRAPRTSQNIRNDNAYYDSRSAEVDGDEALDHFVASVGAIKANLARATEPSQLEASLYDWLRCAIWWFLKGRLGIEEYARALSGRNHTIPISPQQTDRASLRQHYLSLAKAWWIINDVLPRQLQNTLLEKRYHQLEKPDIVGTSCTTLQSAFRRLATSMSKRNILPQPQDALIAGQDASVWLPQPFQSFPTDWSWILSGKIFMPPDRVAENEPLSVMPLSDTPSSICHGRIFARASVAVGDGSPMHDSFDCMVTVLRDQSSPGLKVIIASQSTAVNVVIRDTGEHGVHWEHTRFDRDATTLRVKLPEKLRMHIPCYPRDFEWLSKCYSESQRVTRSLRPAKNERSLGTFNLLSFQYRDSANADQFPAERQEICQASLFECYLMPDSGRNPKVHNGFRVAITTSGKSATSTNILILNNEAPFEYNAMTSDPSLRIQLMQMNRRRSAHLTFEGFQQRDNFRDAISGLLPASTEVTTHSFTINGVSIEPLAETDSNAHAMQLDWRSIKIIDKKKQQGVEEDFSAADVSETLRMVLLSMFGSYVDRLNDASSEFRMRLEAEPFNALQIMRPLPREDVSLAIGPDPSHELALHQIFETITTGPSVMTLAMVSHTDLHTLQNAITGYRVLYDGIASTLSISRRRTGLPINKNWDATGVRLQIIHRDRITQVLAFFKDYVLADCLNFEVKRTDTFEKTDTKLGHCVKMVDAKFVLPGSNTDDWLKEGAQRDAAARFTSLAASEYAAEHEDITVAFGSEEERDRFAEALPAPVTMGRKFTLKRRI